MIPAATVRDPRRRWGRVVGSGGGVEDGRGGWVGGLLFFFPLVLLVVWFVFLTVLFF